MVWEAAGRENFVEDVQAMRRRVEQHVPASEAARQLKLGPGGLRDVEFSVQLLQLVHGRTDESLRSGTTLEALAALAKGGYVARDDAATLDASLPAPALPRAPHPAAPPAAHPPHADHRADLRRLGRAMGHRRDAVAEAVVADRQAAPARCAGIHERLFYRPLLAAVARLSPSEVRLTPEAARRRLRRLGFRDPAGALRHIEALTTGVSRRAAIQRPCSRSCSAGSPTRPTPTPGCCPSGACPTTSGRPTGTSRCSATRGAPPSVSPTVSPAAGMPPTCSSGHPRACRCSVSPAG